MALVSWLKVGEKFIITAGGREIDVMVNRVQAGVTHLSIEADADVDIRKVARS